MTLRALRVAPIVLAALGAAGCTRNPYVIGTICPPVGATSADAGAVDPRCGSTPPPPSGTTLLVGLGRSGAGMPPFGALTLASGAIAPSLALRGERATAASWPTDGAASLGKGSGTPTLGLGAPFIDSTGAVGLPADAPAYVAGDAGLGAVGADDFAVEVVFRALPGASLLAKQSGAIGWSLGTLATGELELSLGDGTRTAVVDSAKLTSGAWYHCLVWASRAAGGRADCDGSAGALTALPSLGSLDAPAAVLAAGGGAPVPVAYLALFRVKAGGLGDSSTWLAVNAQQFAVLTGVNPTLARGSALPAAGLRPSAAYLDLWDRAANLRRLYLVGPDWPRLACRFDAAGSYGCGYLSEPRRARGVPADATAWQPAGLAVAASTTPFPDGEARFATLAPSTAMATHQLSTTATAGSANQVFSFFVRGLGATSLVAASGGTAGTVVFDLKAGQPSGKPMGVTPTMESWGNGIYRCTYAVRGAAGPQTYSIRLLDDAANETFAGSGAPAVEVGGLQVDDGLAFAGSLLAADPQPADHLTFVADDGNLPSGASGSLRASVLLPAGERVTDQAILNINNGGAYPDQVQLFLVGAGTDAGFVKFWRLENNAPHWAFDSGETITDGLTRAITATWDLASARLTVGSSTTQMDAQLANTPLSFDRIDVGFSQASSGALEGLVSGLQIGAM